MADTMSGLEPQEDLDKEMRAISESYAAGGTEETQPRRDYAPYRSSLLRHPTMDLQQVDPEGIELWRASSCGRRSSAPATSASSSRT
jgi:protocatechuate 3,4-dioxygenase beta subunit